MFAFVLLASPRTRSSPGTLRRGCRWTQGPIGLRWPHNHLTSLWKPPQCRLDECREADSQSSAAQRCTACEGMRRGTQVQIVVISRLPLQRCLARLTIAPLRVNEAVRTRRAHHHVLCSAACNVVVFVRRIPSCLRNTAPTTVLSTATEQLFASGRFDDIDNKGRGKQVRVRQTGVSRSTARKRMRTASCTRSCACVDAPQSMCAMLRCAARRDTWDVRWRARCECVVGCAIESSRPTRGRARRLTAQRSAPFRLFI